MADNTKKPSAIHLARAGKADKAAIMELARLDHRESIFGNLEFPEKKFSTLFNKSIDQPGRCITLKAEVKGEIVGFLYCTIGEYFIAENNLQATVHVLDVKKNLRHSVLGGKVAVKLVKAITKWAKAQGVQHVFFYVTSGTRIAQVDSFFRKMGMTTLGGNYAIKF
ncbi:MAG: GNAT family N-acetyltransferase [Gammaproteobacteria bacterium]|nr:GNAT family N-acetyltransferase [Gammaproteobacteria bacterium]